MIDLTPDLDDGDAYDLYLASARVWLVDLGAYSAPQAAITGWCEEIDEYVTFESDSWAFATDAASAKASLGADPDALAHYTYQLGQEDGVPYLRVLEAAP